LGEENVVPLYSEQTFDRRGIYPELRALIDSGTNLDVFFETGEIVEAGVRPGLTGA
jgi:hypothetical protein